MNSHSFQINLLAAWLGFLLGFGSGMVLGLFFRREDWLGGYASFKRRMYRLAHISFFGLGAVNLFFWLTVKALSASDSMLAAASWTFVIGAITMPVCCVIIAHWPKLHLVFSVPVASLLLGGGVTVAVIGSSEGLTKAGQSGDFSLPALSRWEGEQPSPVAVIAQELPLSSRSRNLENRRTIPPLPTGEGQGEGASLELNSLSRTSHESLNPF